MKLIKVFACILIILNLTLKIHKVFGAELNQTTETSEIENVTYSMTDGQKKAFVHLQPDSKTDIMAAQQNILEVLQSDIEKFNDELVNQKNAIDDLTKNISEQFQWQHQFCKNFSEQLQLQQQRFQEQLLLILQKHETSKSSPSKLEALTSLNVSNEALPSGCEEAMGNSCGNDGIYKIKIPESGLAAFEANCKCVDNEIWTIIQNRKDGSVDFYRDWAEYKNGFGNLDGEFWLGLERMHQITKCHQHELIIWLEHKNGTKFWARYSKFLIGSEAEKYKITVDGYSGNAGDELNYPHKYLASNGMKFSTRDYDNDEYSGSCAELWKGAWWFNYCSLSHLNGPYYADKDGDGIYWYSIGFQLKSSQMAIRQSK